ncbi:hypothetical protein CEV32_2865 [Brucella rhizosphaerae]|uniref:Uncharacterized protein n=1 Tax=Brucella rhizosphaerae TaxID=571254 RepID=A0A256F048_9HYPH|nr:hypothetical protein CEV32_2865 [Brucella rhizosphaerae]
MSFPVSTFKALGVRLLKHLRVAHKLPFIDWTNEIEALGHSAGN